MYCCVVLKKKHWTFRKKNFIVLIVYCMLYNEVSSTLLKSWNGQNENTFFQFFDNLANVNRNEGWKKSMISYLGDYGVILDSSDRVLLFILSFQLSTKQLDLSWYFAMRYPCNKRFINWCISQFEPLQSAHKAKKKSRINHCISSSIGDICQQVNKQPICVFCIRFFKLSQLTHWAEHSEYITSYNGTWRYM